MDVLGALIMRFFANSRRCKYQEPEWRFPVREDRSSDGRNFELATGVPERRYSLQLSGPGYGKTDRTAWGVYRESAPPVLPPNTCAPGFEDELVAAVRRLHHDEIESDAEQNDEHETRADSYDGDEENHDTDTDSRPHHDARATRKSRGAYLSGSGYSAFLNRYLTTFTNGNSYSSFGSPARTRSATTTTTTSRSTQDDSPRLLNSNRSIRMAPRTRLWISLWFLLTAPVIFWDAAYCFMRPRSFKGGDLHWIWKPYEIYQEVDYVYGVEAFNRGDGFASAQSFLNVVETLLNLFYLYKQHIQASPAAPLIGFAAVVMTLSKTVLYWAQEYFCGGCAIGHNDLWTLFWFWIVPNGLWLIVPSLIVTRLSKDITASLNLASKVNAAKKE